jgi:hypothetical protein
MLPLLAYCGDDRRKHHPYSFLKSLKVFSHFCSEQNQPCLLVGHAGRLIVRRDFALSGLFLGYYTPVTQGFAAVLTDFALSGLSIK